MAKNSEVKKLQKLFIEFRDKNGDILQYEQSSTDGTGLRHAIIPFNTNTYSPDKISIKLFETDSSFEDIDDDYNYLHWLIARDDENDDCRKRLNQSVVLRDLEEDYFCEKDEGIEFPQFMYSDVTERDLFGYPAIVSSDLKSDKKGIWTNHGFRKFEISINGFDGLELAGSDHKIKVSLFWYMIDSVAIKNIFVDEIRYNKYNNKFHAYIDTNILGEAFKEYEVESKCPRVLGRFEVHHVFNNEKIVYSFPIEVCVHDTRVDEKGKNACLKPDVVSIDFGTSSTCAAVKDVGKSKLFTLSGGGKRSEGDNAYENPTNIMIYNWTEVFKQWESCNKNCPFVMTKSDYVSEKFADYDSGYTVDDEFKKVDEKDGKRKMDAIINHLKMIPHLLAEGKEIKFIPYWDRENSTIRVVDDVAQEDGTHFNPIAFYGYLLARAINNPATGYIYKKYQITYPTKFDNDVREKIRASLEYGIKRALPTTIANGIDKKGNQLVSVTMGYSEPEACVGSVVRKQLKLEGSKAKMFAIYDLGGGTMDFAFGVLREANAEERRYHNQVIEILAIDGDEKIGGEKLIHQISYKIYRDSREKIEENRIKFVLPEGELNPKGFDGLISQGDENANTNVNILNECISRPLFHYYGEIGTVNDVFVDNESGIVVDAELCKVKLRDYKGQEVEVEVTVKEISDFIKNKISDTIVAFKSTLCYSFQNNIDKLKEFGIDDFKISDVMIFLGGNASKQYYVKELMHDDCIGFGKDQIIQFIGEGQVDENLSDEYQVNCKTAVAFGQLVLSNYTVNRASHKEPPFLFNVGYYDDDDNFVTVLEKNERSKDWKVANYVDGEGEALNLYFTTSPTKERNAMKPCYYSVEDFFEDDKRSVYLRVHDEDHMEFRLCEYGMAPSNDEPVNVDMIIKLDNY